MSLNAVKSAVLAATGYDGKAVELTATKVQFVLTIVNSKLNGSPAAERENEATRIASKIASIIADKPEFKGIQAIHVDYVKREADSGTRRRSTALISAEIARAIFSATLPERLHA